MTATLRETFATVFTDGDWLDDVAYCVGDENTPDDLDGYVHYLTLKRRTPALSPAASPILLTTEDGTLQFTSPNLVGPRVRTPQLQTWDDGVYDFEQSWLRPDGITEVVLVTTVTVIKGLSIGGSFAGLPLPSGSPALTVVRSPGQVRIVRPPRGPSGWNGWTAVLSIDDETDPPRRLMRVIDWAGGGGEKPTVGAWAAPGGLTEDPAMASDFGGASTAAAIAATQAAVAAAGAANIAAGNANDKATLADQKATLADQKATLADNAAGAATTAAGNANDKATLADQKATLADQKATLANDKATLADTAATSATAAATAANLTTAAAVAALVGATGQAIVSVSAPRYLTAADHGKLLAFVGAAPALLYIPAGLPAGFRSEVMKGAAGNVFVQALPGAAVGGVAGKTGLTTQYASELLRQISPNNYAVSDGESAAVPPSINFPDFRNARASGLALLSFA